MHASKTQTKQGPTHHNAARRQEHTVPLTATISDLLWKSFNLH